MSDLPPPPSSGWSQQPPPPPPPQPQWPDQPGIGGGAPVPPGPYPPAAGPWTTGYGYGHPGGSGYAAWKAGFWQRFAAVLIDTLVLLPVSILPNLVLNLGPKEEVACPGRTSLVCEQPTSGARALALILTLVALVVAVIYYSQLEGKKGQTVGKQALGIRVVDINSGEVIGVSRGVGRYFARWLSALPCGLGYFWMLWDGQKQTWHDKLTSAVVVRT